MRRVWQTSLFQAHHYNITKKDLSLNITPGCVNTIWLFLQSKPIPLIHIICKPSQLFYSLELCRTNILLLVFLTRRCAQLSSSQAIKQVINFFRILNTITFNNYLKTLEYFQSSSYTKFLTCSFFLLLLESVFVNSSVATTAPHRMLSPSV